MDFQKLKQREVSEALGVAVRTIQRWGRDGCPRNSDGSYDLRAVFEWALDTKSSEPNPETEESQRWLTLFRKERAFIARIERQKAEGNLISREEVGRQWSWRMGEVRSGLIAFCDRLPPLLEGKNHGEMSEVLFDEVRMLYTNYSRDGNFCPGPAKPFCRAVGGKKKTSTKGKSE